MKRLAELLRGWRWDSKLSVREAAEMIGLTAATYSRLERGEMVDGNTLSTVIRWLLERKDEEPAV